MRSIYMSPSCILFLCPLSIYMSPSAFMETPYGVLELLLVSAEGLKHAHHLGPQRHYATIQCGEQIRTSKIAHGKHRKIWWNEKFSFPLSPAECRGLLAEVTLKIMERDKFSEDSLVGETRVNVGDIIREGIQREFLQMKPAPYNIVLQDGTYKGELQLGVKFLSGVNLEPSAVPPRQQQQFVVCKPFLNITLPCIPWRRFFFCARSNNGHRKNI